MLRVEFATSGRIVTDYAVVLLIAGDCEETIRIYDGVHGRNEMHRLHGARGRERAIAVNIAVMRACVELRRAASSHALLEKRLGEIEREMGERPALNDEVAVLAAPSV